MRVSIFSTNYFWNISHSKKNWARDDQTCLLVLSNINILKPTGHVTHQQFNIQQLYVLPILYLCVLYLSEKKQRLVPLTA